MAPPVLHLQVIGPASGLSVGLRRHGGPAVEDRIPAVAAAQDHQVHVPRPVLPGVADLVRRHHAGEVAEIYRFEPIRAVLVNRHAGGKVHRAQPPGRQVQLAPDVAAALAHQPEDAPLLGDDPDQFSGVGGGGVRLPLHRHAAQQIHLGGAAGAGLHHAQIRLSVLRPHGSGHLVILCQKERNLVAGGKGGHAGLGRGQHRKLTAHHRDKGRLRRAGTAVLINSRQFCVADPDAVGSAGVDRHVVRHEVPCGRGVSVFINCISTRAAGQGVEARNGAVFIHDHGLVGGRPAASHDVSHVPRLVQIQRQGRAGVQPGVDRAPRLLLPVVINAGFIFYRVAHAGCIGELQGSRSGQDYRPASGVAGQEGHGLAVFQHQRTPKAVQYAAGLLFLP